MESFAHHARSLLSLRSNRFRESLERTDSPRLTRIRLLEGRAQCQFGARSAVLGTGSPRREFLHVDDLASAAVFLMQEYDGAEIVNVGTGEDVTIREVAEMVRDAVGYSGRIVFDTSKPDGTPRKLLDISRLRALGWSPSISLAEGLAQSYRWYLEQRQHAAEAAGQSA